MEHHGKWVHQTLPQSGKTTVQQRVPRVNLPVQMRETGMKPPSPTPAPQASRLGTPSAGVERGTQVTASASWSPVALPVILFYPCFSEIISLWPGLAGCWPQHPCPKNKRPVEGSRFKA